MKTYTKKHATQKALSEHIKKIEQRGGVILEKYGVGEHWTIKYSFQPLQRWKIGDKFKSKIGLGMGTDKNTIFKIEKKDSGVRYKISFKVDKLERNMLFEENFLSESFANGNFKKTN